MSSSRSITKTATTLASPSTSSVANQTPSKPVDILQTQYSFAYSNLHPVLLLSLLLFRFRALVHDPVTALSNLVPGVALLQSLYCVVCLPSTGQNAPKAAQKGGQKKKAAKSSQDIWSKLVPVFISLLLTLLLSTPILYIIVVLFGAPLTTHLPHTALLAGHLALLTTPQLYYAHGLDKESWLQIASLQLPVDELYGMTLGACVGSWIGAIPIPLDWDREWQKWPITVVTGMYIGAVVGKLAGGYVFKGRWMKIE